MYSLAYIDTAIALNGLLQSIVKYERERLTAIIEGSIRTQAYARDDRSAVTMYLSQISATDETLAMHLEAYRGDDADSAYLSLTPMAQRITMGSIEMLRAVAQDEMDRAWEDSFAEEISGEAAGQLRNLSSEMQAQDAYLYAKALDLNEAYIGVYVPTLN